MVGLWYRRLKPIPPFVTHTALFQACERPSFDLAYCVPFYNTNNIFGVFISIETMFVQFVASRDTLTHV